MVFREGIRAQEGIEFAKITAGSVGKIVKYQLYGNGLAPQRYWVNEVTIGSDGMHVSLEIEYRLVMHDENGNEIMDTSSFCGRQRSA